MNLGQLLAEEILNEGTKTVGLLGMSSKPPSKGHFSVITQALEKYPNLDEFLIYIGSGIRNGISQAESIIIWDIYSKYLPSKVKFIPTTSPVRAIYDYAKEHPNENIKWILGSREGQESDFAEYIKRTSHSEKYPNIETINLITTGDVVSGTKARAAAKVSKEEFYKYIPSELSPEEKYEVYKVVSDVLLENEIKETSFIGRLGLKWDKFLSALKNEKKETQEAFNLIIKSTKGEIKLTPEQKKQIGNQLKDVLKMIGFMGILALPGGTIFLLLSKFLKLNKFITPTSFQNKEKIEENLVLIPKQKYLMKDEFGTRTVRYAGEYKNKHGAIGTYYKFTNLFDGNSFNLYKRHLEEYEWEILKENNLLNENIQQIDPKIFLQEVLDYCCDDLNIPKPKVVLLNKLDFTQENHSFGCYIPSENKIFVVIKGRNLSDSGKTLAHECFHSYQMHNNLLTQNAGEDGDEFENQANSYAGKILRHFNRTYPSILTTFVK